MSKKSVTLYSVILASGILLGLIAGVLWVKDSSETGPVFMPGLNVLGDVSKPFELKDMRVFDQESFEYKGDKYSGIPLASLIIESEPWMENGEDNEILIIGEDGLSASLSGGDLTSCYILFSEKNGWEAINVNHPVSSNIKRIQEIVVIAVDPPMDHSVNIITPENNLASFTPGGIYKEITRIYPYYEGTSSVTKDGTERSASIYTRRMLLPLEDISPGFTGKKMIAMGKTGEYLYINSRGYLEPGDNKIGYLPANRGDEVSELAGIIVDPPSKSVMNLYYDTEHYLSSGQKVLVIFIDGLGFHQYLHALERGYAPFLASLPAAQKALSVYQPVTNAGFAAMITGKAPWENGVYSRAQKDLKVPSIFGLAQELGKNSVLIEGHIKILNTEVEPILNIDLNQDGYNEDEIFQSAIDRLNDGYDLMMVHFHSIDDAGHDYGELDQGTMDAISKVDGYIEQLVQGWDGKVIILSDHGMHSTPEGGSHGVFRYEDLVVPYILAEGGLLN